MAKFSERKELNRLRLQQAARVMPLVGQLLDAWEQVPNDVRSGMAEQCPSLVGNILALNSVVEQ